MLGVSTWPVYAYTVSVGTETNVVDRLKKARLKARRNEERKTLAISFLEFDKILKITRCCKVCALYEGISIIDEESCCFSRLKPMDSFGMW